MGLANYQVSTIRVADLSVSEAVRRGLRPLGGIQRFVRAGDFCLIKVAMAREAEPDSGLIAYPALVTEVARLCHEQGARTVIIERTAGLESNFARYADIFHYAEVVCLDQARHTARPVPLAETLRDEVDWADILDEADVFINIPSLRAHVSTGISNGMQNLLGLLPRMSPRRAHAYGLIGSIVDLNLARPSDLVITDAIYVVGGAHPCISPSYQTGVISMTNNVVVADLVAAKLMGVDPDSTGYLPVAVERGLGPASLDGVACYGEALDELANQWPVRILATGDLQAVAQRHGLPSPDDCYSCWRTLCGSLLALEAESPHLLQGVSFGRGEAANPISFGHCAAHRAAIHIPGCPPRAEALREMLEQLVSRSPRFAVCSIAWRDKAIEDVIPVIAETGYEGIELWGPHIEQYAERRSVDDLRRLLDIAGLTVPMISPYLNLADDVEAGLETAKRYIEYAKRLGAPLIRVFVGGGDSALAKHAVWERTIQALKQVCAWGAERGVAFAFETHQHHLHDTTESTLRLIRQVGSENLGVNLDIHNLFDMGEDPQLAWRRLLPHVRIMHVKNGRYVDGKLVYGVPLASGNMDYAPFLHEVCASNYGAYMSVEWFGQDQAKSVAHELTYLRAQCHALENEA